jgi:hypothetical protein
MEDLEKAGSLSHDGLCDRSGEVPFGEPGAVWMTLVTSTAGVRGVRSSIVVVVSGELDEVRRPVAGAACGGEREAQRAGGGRVPGCVLTASVARYPEQLDWMVLTCDGSTRRDASAEDARSERRMWAHFLREYAETTEAGFGYLSDEADFAGPRTALEISLGLFREDTLGRLGSQVRGYSCITVISPGVAELLGGAGAIERTQAFDEVVVLRSGALWLEAAPDLSQYDEERRRRVFETLATVLPPGLPGRDRRARKRRLVYADAAEFACGTEGLDK